MYKLITATILLLLFSSCDRLPSFTSEHAADRHYSVEKITGNLHLKLVITSEKIERLQDIEATFILANISTNPLTYHFNSGCQFGFTLTRDATTVFDSRNNIACIQVLTQFTLETGESKKYSIALDGYHDRRELDPGNYQLTAFLLNNNNHEISIPFTVE